MKSTHKKLEDVLTHAYHDHKKKLYMYARTKIQNPDVCEDLVQAAYMKTWSYLVRNGDITFIKSFLYHALKALIIDEYRKYKSYSLDSLMESGFELCDEGYKNASNTFDGEQAVALIDNLPEKYKKVVHMRYIRGLHLREISKLTGQTNNAVAVCSHRGLEKLKVLYREQHLELQQLQNVQRA